MSDPTTVDTSIYADRLPTDEEMIGQQRNTRESFHRGDLVIHPEPWGRSVFIVDATHANHDHTLTIQLARRRSDGAFEPDHGWTAGAANPRDVVRVCGRCLKLDPLNLHLLACDDETDPEPRTPTVAERTFDALDDSQRRRLLSALFNTLEYSDDGTPGREWNADTWEKVSGLFAEFGVTFSDPTGGNAP